MRWLPLIIALTVGAGVFCSERWLEQSRYSIVRSNHKSVAYRLDHQTGKVQVLLGWNAHPVKTTEPPVVAQKPTGSFTQEEVERALIGPTE